MPVRVAHLLEIVVLAAGTNALLRRGRPAVSTRRLLESKEDLLELHHSGVREQERRVIGGNER